MLVSIVMSYPRLLHARCFVENSVIFTVPNYPVVEKITQDNRQERDLRVKVGASSLSFVISELALLLSTYEAEIISSHEHNTLTIRLITGPSSRVVMSRIERKAFAMRRRIHFSDCQVLRNCGITGAHLASIEEECAHDTP